MKFSNNILPGFLSNTSITTTTVPSQIDGATTCGVFWQASNEHFLLNIPDVARYLVTGGNTICVEPSPLASSAEVARFMIMTPLAALAYQKGLLAFHAAAVSDHRGVILLAGDSGVGKSTLLFSLLQRGWTMLADDMAVLERDSMGQLVVNAGLPSVALWPNSLNKQGVENKNLSFIDANRLEFIPKTRFAEGALPLRAIFWLGVNSSKKIDLEELHGSLYFRASGALLYNSHIADALCNRLSYLQQMALLTKSTPLLRLRRPRGSWCVEELANIVSA